MTKTCVLLVAVQRSDVRPTLCDVMMMYSQDRYMKNLPKLQPLDVSINKPMKDELPLGVRFIKRFPSRGTAADLTS